METLENEGARCLNCGRELGTDNYCGNCGQHRSEGRLTKKQLTAAMLSDYTSIEAGFLFTCKELLFAPWRVISDYIKGKRVRYISPMQMLGVLSLLQILLSYIFDDPEMSGDAGQRAFEADSPFNESGTMLVVWYVNSPIFQYFTILLPVIPVFMWITKYHGQHIYNFAETLLATIYASSSLFIADLIALPLNMLPIDSFLPEISMLLAFAYISIVGGIGVYKSLNPLPIDKKRKILRVTAFYVCSLLLYSILMLALLIVIGLFFVKGAYYG